MILCTILFAALAPIGAQASSQTTERASARPGAEAEWAALNGQVLDAIRGGAVNEGVALATRALALAEAAFGPDHEHTLVSLNNLAHLFSSQGRYAAAEPLYVRALQTSERLFGRGHRDTLVYLANLASLYASMGHYAEAEPLHRRALETNERLLGAEHPDSLSFSSNLSMLYDAQGRYAEAEALAVRILQTRERVFGPEHADTLTSANNLAVIYHHQGRYAEAEPLQVRLLETRERLLGADHPSTLLSLDNLAALYDVVGRYAEAEPLYLRGLQARERVLGRDNPDTILTVNNLAALYSHQSRYSEAEPLYRRALASNESVLGPEHPGTLLTVSNLATLYYRQGRNDEAGPLFLRALQGRERVLGREHADTLHTLSSLAELYDIEGRTTEAEPLFTRALEARGRVLGAEHSDTINSAISLAIFYGRQGRYAEAEPLFVRALEARTRLFGVDHASTIVVASELAGLRLASRSGAATAIGPARIAVAALRARRAAGETDLFTEAQRGREEIMFAGWFSLLADAAWSAPDRASLIAEAFSALQDATAGTTNRAVMQMAVRRVAEGVGAGLGAVVRERISLSEQWTLTNTRYSAALAAPGAQSDVLLQALRTERATIEARIGALDAILRRDFPDYFALMRPEPVDLAATQALLGPDEAILMVVPTRFGTHVLAVSHSRIQWARSSWTQAQVDEGVGKLLRDIQVTMADEGYTYDRQTAHALYQQLVLPVAGVLEGMRHLYVVTTGSLTSMPFGILVTDAPQGADDDPEALRGTRWFADAHALIQMPSIQSLQFLRRSDREPHRASGASTNFIGFGDPVLGGQAVARGRGGATPSLAAIFSGRQTRSGGALADINQIRRLSRLPGTAVELEQMRAALGAPAASVFLAERATERAFRTMDLSGARVLVLATHGLVAGEVRGASEPGLVFTPPASPSEDDDGFLTASEVTLLRLDADWVILSACNTAAGDGSEGAAGLSGLAKAFFYAGARNLLASHWPVADEAAPRLTVRAIAFARENPSLSRAEALQRSTREIRDDTAHPAWAHPGVWAPFSLIGDGAR